MGKQWKQWLTELFWAPKSLQMVIAAMKLKDTYPLEEKLWQTNKKHTKKQRHYFVNKDPSSQSNGFSSSHVWMWELDHKESWALKNWWFWVVVLEKTLESLLDCREINQLILSKLQELVMDRGSLIYCSPWDHEESHMSKQVNWAEPLIMVRGQLCSGGWE